jgi:hypothetical protein
VELLDVLAFEALRKLSSPTGLGVPNQRDAIKGVGVEHEVLNF